MESYFRGQFHGQVDQFENFIAKSLKVDDFIKQIYVWGRSGANTGSLLSQWPKYWLGKIRPDLLLLEIGSNDITLGWNSEYITEGIMRLVERARAELNCVVVIISVLPREARLGRVSVQEFDTCRYQVRDFVRQRVTVMEGVIMFNHKGFTEKQVGNRKVPLKVEDWAPDRIHPGDNIRTGCEGWKKYLESLRSALWEANSFFRLRKGCLLNRSQLKIEIKKQKKAKVGWNM